MPDRGADRPGAVPTWQVSQRASEGETRLLRGLLGLAAESASQEQLVPLTPVMRLSQARGHLCAREFFCMRFMAVFRSGWSSRVCFLRVRGLRGRWRSRAVVLLVLPGPAPRTLPRDHDALEEQLAAPDTPGLTTLECPVEAQDRTGQSRQSVLANSTSAGDSANHSSGLFARHGSSSSSTRPARRGGCRARARSAAPSSAVENADGHISSPPSGPVRIGSGCLGNRKAADPGVGFRGLEAADASGVTQIGGLQASGPGKAPVVGRGRATNDDRAEGAVAHDGRLAVGRAQGALVAGNGHDEARRGHRRLVMLVMRATSFGASGARVVRPLCAYGYVQRKLPGASRHGQTI